MKMKILYAEDEKQMSMAITEILKMENYDVDAVYDGVQALEHLQSGSYDAVILDIMMPKMDGTLVLKQMREQNDFTPVMLLTAKAETDDRIEGFSIGADDYLGKPFSAGELVVRLNAMIRRSTRYKVKQLSMGNITLNCESYELKSDIGGLRLSDKETQLLSLFIQNKSTSFTEGQIREKLWADTVDDGIVTLYISYLQNKLKQIHSTVNIKQSETGFFIGEYGTDCEK